MEKNLFPWLGNIEIEKVTAPLILPVLRRIEARGAVETAHRCKTICSQIMRYAVATGRAERDPCADLRLSWLLLSLSDPVIFVKWNGNPSTGKKAVGIYS